MAGWSHTKRVKVEKAFYVYLDDCYVDSRDYGRISLGKHLYSGQRRCITAIFDALEAGKHKIFVLKSRQLGISTLIRALIVFLQGVKAGLKAAIVFDTDNNKNQSRVELEHMIEALPKHLGFPKIKTNNRAGLMLENASQVLFMSAGVKKSKTSGTLGRSVGLAMAHCSELCSWDNDDGLEAFQQSLSDVNPDRLYIYESTARGYEGCWYQLWKDARDDPQHCVCLFLGWFSKDSQRIERDDPDYALYGEFPPNEDEIKKIKEVRDRYGVEITAEQLAWVRRCYDPAARREGDADPKFEASTTRIQEQPWTEDEAFQMTGSIFFTNEKLAEITETHVSDKFQTYMFCAGQAFQDMIVVKAGNAKSIDLKVWEEPEQDADYVLGIDPAYGHDENNDRSSIQICRCYADGLTQVAEYATPLATTDKLAWVVASLLGWYGSGNNRVRYALELNGPGEAVFNELKNLRHQIDAGYQSVDIESKGLKDVFRNVRTYIYSRADAMTAGHAWHLKTNVQTKVTYMERLRDFVTNGSFYIRSAELISEMRTIEREGDAIKASGHLKDDRVMAAAFAVHCWETGPRRNLVQNKRTRDAEAARRRTSILDQVNLFNSNKLQDFFAEKKHARLTQQRMMVRQTWRYR